MGWRDICGWSEFEDFYRAVVPALPDGAVVVEVGVAYGRSIALLDELVQASGKRAAIIAVDSFDDYMGGDQDDKRAYWEWAKAQGSPLEAFYASLDKHSPGTTDRIIVLHALSNEGPAALGPSVAADLVFLDADHSYGHVCSDIDAWWPMVKPGGMLAGDDYDPVHFPGVIRAVCEKFPFHNVRGRVWARRKAGGE